MLYRESVDEGTWRLSLMLVHWQVNQSILDLNFHYEDWLERLGDTLRTKSTPVSFVLGLSHLVDVTILEQHTTTFIVICVGVESLHITGLEEFASPFQKARRLKLSDALLLFLIRRLLCGHPLVDTTSA